MENPFYISELRDLTARDNAVREYVLKQAATEEVLGHIVPCLRFALRRYGTGKQARLGVAFGCTGGRHRSVVIADEVARAARGFWPGEIEVEHRDVDRSEVRT